MKKLVLLAAFISFTVVSLKADPAKKVNLNFNNGVLSIEAVHPVKNVSAHYIDQFTVNVNGKTVKTVKLSQQSSKEAETLDIAIPEIKSGSEVEVISRCNQFGKKAGKLKVK